MVRFWFCGNTKDLVVSFHASEFPASQEHKNAKPPNNANGANGSNTNINMHAQQFHDTFKPVTKGKNTLNKYTLKRNSANASHFMYDGFKNNHLAQLIVKVQENENEDPIINDAFVCLTLESGLSKHPQAKAHFMQYAASFMGQTDAQYYYLPDPTQKSQLKKAPCLAVDRVVIPVALYNMNIQMNTQKWVFVELAEMFKAMVLAGMTTGFAHNDLHTCNVLHDKATRKFVVIDYGRAHVVNPNAKNLETRLHSTFGNTFNRWRSDDPESNNRAHSRIIKGDDKYKGMYVLNDIAGLSRLLAEKISPPFSNNTNDLIINIYKCMSVENFSVTGFSMISDLAIESPAAFALLPGLLWYQAVIEACTNAVIKRVTTNNLLESQIQTVKEYVLKNMFMTDEHYIMINRYAFEDAKEDVKPTYDKFVPMLDAWLRVDFNANGKNKQRGGSDNHSSNTPTDSEKMMTTITTAMETGDFKVTMNMDMDNGQTQTQSLARNFNNDYVDLINTLDADKARNKIRQSIDTNYEILAKQQTLYAGGTTLLKALLKEDNSAIQKLPSSKANVKKGAVGVAANATAAYAAAAAAAAGGGRIFVLRTERKTERRYVIVSRRKWYLDEHRGQYRYANTERNAIHVMGAR